MLTVRRWFYIAIPYHTILWHLFHLILSYALHPSILFYCLLLPYPHYSFSLLCILSSLLSCPLSSTLIPFPFPLLSSALNIIEGSLHLTCLCAISSPTTQEPPLALPPATLPLWVDEIESASIVWTEKGAKEKGCGDAIVREYEWEEYNY